MIKIEETVTASAEQWEIIIEGMRNPKNSWDRMDSKIYAAKLVDNELVPGISTMQWEPCAPYIEIGDKDLELMHTLNKGGPVHAKYRRMIPVYVTLSAPLYWWKEMDTYKVGTVRNSCSTMHKITEKEFDISDFSCEQLIITDSGVHMCNTIDILNKYRKLYLEEKTDFKKKKLYWWQLIQLLPSSYNQKATLMLNYEVLTGIYRDRKNHKLDEWHTFCEWIEKLPYSELITGNVPYFSV